MTLSNKYIGIILFDLNIDKTNSVFGGFHIQMIVVRSTDHCFRIVAGSLFSEAEVAQQSLSYQHIALREYDERTRLRPAL